MEAKWARSCRSCAGMLDYKKWVWGVGPTQPISVIMLKSHLFFSFFPNYCSIHNDGKRDLLGVLFVCLNGVFTSYDKQLYYFVPSLRFLIHFIYWWCIYLLSFVQILTVFSFFLSFFSFPRQAYENCTVLEARICYNVAKLMYLMSERYQQFNYHSVRACVSECVCVSLWCLVIIWLWGLDFSLTQLLFCMQEEDGAQQEILPGPEGEGEHYQHGQSQALWPSLLLHHSGLWAGRTHIMVLLETKCSHFKYLSFYFWLLRITNSTNSFLFKGSLVISI